ncbi:MAG: RagB/SusD family nutrient uptake outer membrane protein [Emticicia sp.]|nr:RagB/SusD family nutrient uptake outer membrane protein [Emticicia sp.]
MLLLHGMVSQQQLRFMMVLKKATRVVGFLGRSAVFGLRLASKSNYWSCYQGPELVLLWFSLRHCPITGATESNGVRVIKYQPDVAAPGGQGENDFVIFRLADIMLVKAEALVRLQEEHADALPIVNKVRDRSGLTALASIDLDGIYKERGKRNVLGRCTSPRSNTFR